MRQSKRQLILAVAIIGIFMSAVVAFTYFALQQIKKSSAEQIRDNLQTLLLTVQEAHHILLEQRRYTIESVSENESFMQLSQQLVSEYQQKAPIVKSDALMAIRQFMNPVLENFSDNDFYIIAPDYTNIASMRNAALGSQNIMAVQAPEHLAKVFSGQTVFVPPVINYGSELVVNNRTYDTRMFIIAPIFNSRVEVIAAIALRINPKSYFTNITTLGRVGETGETYAFDSKGRLLTDSRFIAQLRRINIVGFSGKSDENILLKDPGGDLTQGYKPRLSYHDMPMTLMASEAIAGRSGINVDGYRDYRGVLVFGAWLWEPDYQFGIATEINVEEALQPYYKTRNTLLTLISITSLLCVFLLKFFIVTQRLHQRKIMQANASLEQRISDRTQDLEQAKEELSRANQELEVLVITDSLTGLSNRRHFDTQYSLEWQRCLRDNRSIAIIILDIDYFKQYNDFYGHLSGDLCLQNVGSKLKEINITKRPSDIIARYGGEEFIVMLSNTTEDYVKYAAETICASIREMAIPHQRSGIGSSGVITVSVGYAITDDLKGIKANKLINKADKALYEAKREGRNTVVKYKEEATNVTSLLDHKSNKKK
ncbi:diguanylate cyclase domain-containing protein [Thalassotalea euphylliae]|uniref:sensor domain-containing diguanylate cyclase n=1 Tax=Thalassotalea euphylliae TaxID=1655234 RepID=UPI00363127CA